MPPLSPTALVRATAAAPPSSAYRPQRCGAGCAASLLAPRTCGVRQRRGHTVSMPVIHRSSRGEARGLTRWKRSASPPQPLFAGSGLGARPGTSSPRSPAGSCWPPGLFLARRPPSRPRSSHAAVRSGSSPNPPRRPMSCSSRLSPSCSSSVSANNRLRPQAPETQERQTAVCAPNRWTRVTAVGKSTHRTTGSTSWKRHAGPLDVPTSLLGWASDEFVLAEAVDVHEVIAWADERVDPDGQYTLYVVVDNPDGPGLVHLSGTEPTRVG